MPATRTDRSRSEKIDLLLDAAEGLFVERGYESTTMAAIAKRAGVASNVVYWYFESKDAVFVAALRRMVDRAIEQGTARVRRRPADLASTLATFVVGLGDASPLIGAVHERAAHSEAVATFHAEVHTRYTDVLTAALTERGLTPADAGLAGAALISVIEGLLMHGATKREIERMIAFVVERLVPGAG